MKLHILSDILILSAVLGIPFFTSDSAKTLFSDNPDSVSSASVTVEKPSGNYLVLINLNKHTDTEALAVWETFFQGGEIDLLFEDIICVTAKNDSSARTLAENYRSRLPENQCILKTEDVILMLSKAEYLNFDVIVISQEIADIYHADTLYHNSDIKVISVQGATS